MTSSKDKREAEAIIRNVLEETSDEYLHLRIDQPIEMAAASFVFDGAASITHATFTRVTGDFVRHVYENAFGEKMSSKQAFGEAVMILEKGYEGQCGRGYYTALLDAFSPRFSGLEHVLAQMIGYITATARARHIKWVFARLDFSDWPRRCLIAEILLEGWGAFLPPNLRACHPSILANHLSELISLILSTERTINKMLGVQSSDS